MNPVCYQTAPPRDVVELATIFCDQLYYLDAALWNLFQEFHQEKGRGLFSSILERILLTRSMKPGSDRLFIMW